MIKIEHLWFSYTGKSSYILSDINVNIEDGEYISVIGENGCGKTTLIRILLGFIKPTKGDITIDTKCIGYVPQRNDFSNTDFPITVYEVMYSYLKLIKRTKPSIGFTRSDIKDRNIIMEALKQTGMESYKNSLMGNLSGGQTQKILIARALLGTPGLLILDEPSTGVDADSQIEIYGLLKNLSQEKNITVVAVEHNLEAVFSNSTKIFHLQDGHGHLCSPDQYASEYLHYQRKD